MRHRDLPNAKPAALGLEIQLGVEQRRPRQQGRRRIQHLASHQLQAAVDVPYPHAVQRTHQEVEDAGNDQPVVWVGPTPSPARGQVRGGHQVGQRVQIGGIELSVAIHERYIAHPCGP